MRAALAYTTSVEQTLEATLTQEELRNLKHWRTRSRGPYSMLTRRFRDGTTKITTAEYRRNNKRYSDWLNWYMEREAEHLKGTIERNDFCYHYSIGPHALGMDYLKKLVSYGLNMRNIRAVDWLPDAIRAGRCRISKLFEMDQELAIIGDIIVRDEIKRFANSDSVNPDSARITQLARVVEHEADAAEMLRVVGRSLTNPKNIVVAVGAFPGEVNDSEPTVTSRHYPIAFHLEHLSAGAGREVRVVRDSKHRDLANVISAITCQAV